MGSSTILGMIFALFVLWGRDENVEVLHLSSVSTCEFASVLVLLPLINSVEF